MLYAILCEDAPGTLAKRLENRVAEFASRDAAIAWAAEDPYTAAGVFSRVTVKPFRKVLP
jgi:uncharacterized protein YciI